ncbi:phosphopantetheine--protein transferase-like protein [Silvibacterium bohemicum]|uniref:Phosphopantetheine--protein transferase-like protein n=1 Tax=Silvibacterium bohemicum TaxID=1577686 RepID=A0A841K102_9BACT|nr:4'-phosphopantetheinyl transferase superfamily protein [Silvibacterium bohemicum]MBB6147262.1 phosphopantetheine--protein transferase-like protein [Silvibacterium bohemicum]
MTETDLKEIVATLGRTDASRITGATALDGNLAGSLARARLAVMLRSKYSITDPAVYKVATFGDLCSLCGLGHASSNGNGHVAAPSAPLNLKGSGEVSLGVDIESVAAMPEAVDLWEAPFYQQTFTRQEIAYAHLQPSPKASLAAMWSAKEAVRKAIPGLYGVDWQRIEVLHDESGKPSINLDGVPLAGALSLSHTDEAAFAAFVSVPAPKPVPPPVIVAAPVAAPAEPPKTSNKMALLALLVAIVALVVAFLRH